MHHLGPRRTDAPGAATAKLALSSPGSGNDLITSGEFWRTVGSLVKIPRDAASLVSRDGETIKIGDHSAQVRISSDVLTCIEMTHPGGFGPPEHVHHREDELFLVLKGSYAFKVGQEIFELSAGTMLLAPRGIPHAFRTSAEGGSTLVITVPGGFERFLREVAQSDPTRAADIATLARGHGIEFVGPPISDRFWSTQPKTD